MAPKFWNVTKGKQVSTNTKKSLARLNEAFVLHQQGLLEQAKEIYDGILKDDPRHFDALHLLGVIAHQKKDHRVALVLIDKAIKINPTHAAAHSNRGNVLIKLHHFNEALKSLNLALSLDSNDPNIHTNRGDAFLKLNSCEAALASYDMAIKLNPYIAEAHTNRAAALMRLKRYEEGLTSYDKAINVKPDFTVAYVNQGNARLELKQYEAAITSYERAFELEPLSDYLLGMLMHARMSLCCWDSLPSLASQLTDNVLNNLKVVTPFISLSITDALFVQRKVTEIWVADKLPAIGHPMWSGQRYEHKKIRLAYVSCDFKVHPAALNNIGICERHDRDKFELIAISYGPVYPQDSTPEGLMRTRLVNAFDRFLDVGDRSDEQIAHLMRELEIDIAVDISGTMGTARQGIFAHRPAPVQVNLYGYTSGSTYMDYIVSDRVVIPPESQWGYTEKVAYMPDSWFPNDTTRQISARQFSKEEMGLPQQGVVYCSFNNAYKINPHTFDVWMRILRQVPGSVLWLQGAGQVKVKENLRREAQARGVDADRLVFANKLESMAQHLARHRLADVFLDTLPFNAQTTAVDALWAGLPVLTCVGESAFSRVAASLLKALGLEEMVSQDWQAYEAHAVRIGLEDGYAKSLKERLESAKKEAPLFDIARLTRNMEKGYEQMHQRVQQGLDAQAFEVEPRVRI